MKDKYKNMFGFNKQPEWTAIRRSIPINKLTFNNNCSVDGFTNVSLSEIEWEKVQKVSLKKIFFNLCF